VWSRHPLQNPKPTGFHRSHQKLHRAMLTDRASPPQPAGEDTVCEEEKAWEHGPQQLYRHHGLAVLPCHPGNGFHALPEHPIGGPADFLAGRWRRWGLVGRCSRDFKEVPHPVISIPKSSHQRPQDLNCDETDLSPCFRTADIIHSKVPEYGRAYLQRQKETFIPPSVCLYASAKAVDDVT